MKWYYVTRVVQYLCNERYQSAPPYKIECRKRSERRRLHELWSPLAFRSDNHGLHVHMLLNVIPSASTIQGAWLDWPELRRVSQKSLFTLFFWCKDSFTIPYIRFPAEQECWWIQNAMLSLSACNGSCHGRGRYVIYCIFLSDWTGQFFSLFFNDYFASVFVQVLPPRHSTSGLKCKTKSYFFDTSRGYASWLLETNQ